MNNQLHNQIKQLSDRELLEGIYQMLLVVMQEQLISDSKQLGINVIKVVLLIIVGTQTARPILMEH